MTEDTRALRLPNNLCLAAEQRYSGRFANLEQLLIFVLEQLLKNDTAEMDKAEEAVIEQRLKDLGYI